MSISISKGLEQLGLTAYAMRDADEKVTMTDLMHRSRLADHGRTTYEVIKREFIKNLAPGRPYADLVGVVIFRDERLKRESWAKDREIRAIASKHPEPVFTVTFASELTAILDDNRFVIQPSTAAQIRNLVDNGVVTDRDTIAWLAALIKDQFQEVRVSTVTADSARREVAAQKTAVTAMQRLLPYQRPDADEEEEIPADRRPN